MTTATPENTDVKTTFASLDPRDGSVIAEYPQHGPQEVGAAVGRARQAQKWWWNQGPRGRKRWLLEFKKALAARSEELASVIARETGKPHDDALLEVLLAIEHLDWAAKNAPKVLEREKVGTGVLMSNQKAYVDRIPFGVVGVIGPWNYPVYTPMGSISHALAAGNAVVFKPSEMTPGAGEFLADTWRSLGASGQIIEVVTGYGDTGAALVESGVDKVAFTGSPRTARKIMESCSKNLTPLVIEGGGKDAMIVLDDADLKAAAQAAAFGAFGNAGQTCVGIERVYVVEKVADAFIDELLRAIDGVRPGAGEGCHYGPMTLPGQVDIIRRHIDDALAHGGVALRGGPDSVGERYVEPVVISGVDEHAAAMREETFGPVIVINRVADEDDAVARTNDSTYGLGGSIYTGDTRRGEEIASRLVSGAVSVNGIIAFGGVGSLPLGGVRDSGFGRIHGADGLREFTRPRAVTVERFKAPLDLMNLKRDPKAMKTVRQVIRYMHGGGKR
ncbi:aldehyde dehydrogenase family protein [Corynebacterium hansenii]|uniref:Aldehyde dehydrogenase n=1 Tax=Corynebacterium hansenii TaxID=394964 RepID=A0ABV7ZMR0_9CORY|nr:aldehyde dehydrogenase family protein [Corynebacterium hansenii]WJZ00434.1 Succinate-semialdehyde dehydrogenase [NADP(+)] [Corynebacterium hansenii]